MDIRPLNRLGAQPITRQTSTQLTRTVLQPTTPLPDTPHGTGHAADEQADARRGLRALSEARTLGRGVSRRRRYALGRAGIDAVALLLAAGASVLGAQFGEASPPPAGWLVLHLVIVAVLLSARGAYRFRLQVSPLENVRGVVGPTATATMVILLVRTLVEGSAAGAAADSVRLWGFVTAYLLVMRTAVGIASYRPDRRGLNTLVVGAGAVGQRVASRLLDRPQIGLHPIGFLDKEPRELSGATGDLQVLGASWDLERVIRERDVDHVLVTFSSAPTDVLLNLVRTCRRLGVEVSLVPRLFEEVSTHVGVEHLGGVALLRVDQSDPRGWQFEVKYAIERAIGILMVLAAAPLLLGIALIVRLSSPGPVLFRQPRIGLDGQVFDILKFRTMKVAPPGVENDAAWAARTLGHEVAAARPIEDRRTPIGRFLRRWSLDELPQLLNVARGEMSLVGPRPERSGYVEAFERHVYRYGDRHRVKSGLTGWAQVNGLRGETSLEDRIEWDNWYVENWSFWLDLKIMLLTVPAVLSGSGDPAEPS